MLNLIILLSLLIIKLYIFLRLILFYICKTLRYPGSVPTTRDKDVGGYDRRYYHNFSTFLSITKVPFF